MKKQIMMIGAGLVLATGLLTSSTFAHGMGGKGMGGMMMHGTPEQQAEMLNKHLNTMVSVFGITLDQAKTYWAEDKNIHEIAKERNISETDLKTKMQAIKEAEMKIALQNMVSKGLITQAQADSKLAKMKTKMTEMKGKMGQKMGKMFGGR
jgi:F0F1-type ATP synthase membrane subunit c/vacuolar-type H+-ATPase subunit K